MTRRETAAGGVVYRRRAGEVEIVIAEQCDRITGKRTLRLPKGKLDPGESPEAAAAREVLEESGVAATPVAPLCSERYVYHEAGARVQKEVHFFLMRWESGDPRPADGEMERVSWCPIADAAERLTYESERAPVRRARERLAAGAAA